MYFLRKYDILRKQYDVCLRRIVVSLRDDSKNKDDIRGCRPFLNISRWYIDSFFEIYYTDINY